MRHQWLRSILLTGLALAQPYPGNHKQLSRSLFADFIQKRHEASYVLAVSVTVKHDQTVTFAGDPLGRRQL